MSKPYVIPRKSKPTATSEAVDIAARFFVYKLFDATDGSLARAHPVRMLREAEATVSRAVERGWIVLRDEVSGKAKQRCAALTEVGRLMARRALR